MINIQEIVQLLSDKNADNIICRKFDLKPKNIAMFIAALANTSKEYGYIVIGTSKNEEGYNINGISRSFRVDGVIQAAVKQLSYQPIVDHQMCMINDKNICIIRVKKYEHDIFIDEKNESKVNEKDALIRALYLASIKLQSNSLYKDVTEDQRNDFIRDLLETGGYQVKDQTRRGISNSGKASGEVDIFIHENGFPVTIIEALNLRSLDKTYLDNHIDKIYKYDTLGNRFNVVLSYVMVKDFGDFWIKYCEHVKLHNYPHRFIGADESVDTEYDYSDIRFMITKHNRSGKETLLYHMCVKIPDVST